MAGPAVVRAQGQTRSTQSFVYVMSSVWKQPSLTAVEVAWRWCAGLPILACIVWWGWLHAAALQAALMALETVTAFKPLEGAATVSGVVTELWAVARGSAGWFAPAALLLWISAGAIGQNLVARRMDAATKRAAGTIFWLRLLRMLGVVVVLGIWGSVVRWARETAIARPVAHGAEPSFLIFMTITIVSSLVLFVGWAVVASPLELAQSVAARSGCNFAAAMQAAFRNRRLRAQMIEVSLVLCIVRITLLVLALVFSACPLPFSSVETADFLRNWWIGVAIWYLLTSDFFHVVRLAASAELLAADSEP